MILKGYFLTNDKKARVECKQTILKCAETVTLVNPSMSEKSYEIEMNSRKQRDAFQHALEHGGHSVAIAVEGEAGKSKEKLLVSIRKKIQKKLKVKSKRVQTLGQKRSTRLFLQSIYTSRK